MNTRWIISLVIVAGAAGQAAPIDRHALVTRHNPHLTALDPWAPLSVGNGGFCFTADITGLQTFQDYYRTHGVTLETQARWSWHEDPNPAGYQLADSNEAVTINGRTTAYPINDKVRAGIWLRRNPHTQPLPQLALDLSRDGAPLTPDAVGAIEQTLDLWSGLLTSRCRLDGVPVTVSVAAAPDADTLAVRIASSLVSGGRLGLRLALPRGHELVDQACGNPALDWSQPDSHTTTIRQRDDLTLALDHHRGASQYSVRVGSREPLVIANPAPHVFRLSAAHGEVLEFTVSFAARPPSAAPEAAALRAATAVHWEKFWRTGGAIDFSGSTDPRAAELERRIVLSQYLMAIQEAGDIPPQEGGLTYRAWYGKHHLEMIWWHTAQFALWGREELLAKNLTWFDRMLPVARKIAAERGLRGARWPKMVGPDGRESPGRGNPMIVWNQPHPIYLAELLYRAAPTRETLGRWRAVVLETADAMASLLVWDETTQRYHLGPPLLPAQESHDTRTATNPTFELGYWRFGLRIAQEWRQRLGLGRDPVWDKCRQHLAPLPEKGGRYLTTAVTPDTWSNPARRRNHPSLLMALGFLPGDGVDRETMRRTLDGVLTEWDWDQSVWGWDNPLVAMTAARLGEPAKAVEILLRAGPKNGYSANGHVPQNGYAFGYLPVYLPANGALLSAVALMAAGWDGATSTNAPGFPQDGSWIVRSEGLRPLP